MSDPREVVAKGYEALGGKYWEWSRDHDPKFREEYVATLLDHLPAEATVVELGSGSRLPTAKLVTEHHRLVCVDIAQAQLDLVAQNAPAARRIKSDMTCVQFRPESVDGVIAFYSIIHVPREDHEALFRSIASWLRPGGLFVACLGARDNAHELSEWIGVDMYWSQYDADTNRGLLRDAGFTLLNDEVRTQFEDGRQVSFLWVVCRKDS